MYVIFSIYGQHIVVSMVYLPATWDKVAFVWFLGGQLMYLSKKFTITTPPFSFCGKRTRLVVLIRKSPNSTSIHESREHLFLFNLMYRQET